MKHIIIFLLAVSACRAGDVVVDIAGGDVRDVVRAIADAHGLSVVVPGDLAGQASVRLDGVPAAASFEAVLSPLGYRARIVSGKLTIIERKPVEASVSLSHKLVHRVPSDLGDALSNLIREGESAKLVGDEVHVHAPRARAVEVLSALRRWDSRLRQLEVECRFQEVTAGTLAKLGIDWGSLGALEVGAKADYKTGEGFSAVLSMSQLASVISAFESGSKNTVLSNPRLLAVEGFESSVVVGQKYPIPQYTIARDNGVMSVSGFSFSEVGVVLRVTPRFLPDRVVLDLSPEVSHVVGTVPFGGVGAAEIPVIATRAVKTRVELRDGETVVLSGLTSVDEQDSQNGVKGLSRVPVVGGAFRSKKKTSTAVELLIFVTVRFVSP